MGRVRSKPRPIHSLPDTMRQNADGTVSIYTNASNMAGKAPELYTEIPFFAFHGMQTTERDECGVISAYVENFNEVIEDVGGVYEDGTKRPVPGKVTPSLLIATAVTASLQFLVGFNIVVLNNPEKYVFPGHRTIHWSMAVAGLAIGAPFGASLGGSCVAHRGRHKTLVMNILVFMMGGFIQTFAPSLACLTVARFIIGIASGVATVLVPIYLGELAPPNLRGTIGTVNQFAHVSGILMADVLSFRFATENGWRTLFSVNILLTSIQLLLSYFVVESPRWLIENNDPRAKQALQQLRGYQEEEALERELGTYSQATKAHGQETESIVGQLARMLSRSQDRYLFFCSLLLHVAKQLSGANAVFYYSTSIFQDVINDPMVITTLIGSVNVFFTYVALLLMDSCRRKSLLLWSVGGMLCACLTIILAQVGIIGSSISLVAVNVYIAFFEIGIGPIPWVIIAEMFEAKHVTVVMILCSQVGWVVNFMVSLVFPSLNRLLGDYIFVPFAFTLGTSVLFIWFALPETQGRTPAQVLVDVQWKASYADRLAAKDIGNCSGGDWKDKVLD